LPLAPIRAVTASVAASRAAVECVTAIVLLLNFLCHLAHEFNRFRLASGFTGNLYCHPQFAGLAL
jgi:hypothetical protein